MAVRSSSGSEEVSLRENIVNINNCRFSKQEVAASKQVMRQLLNTIP